MPQPYIIVSAEEESVTGNSNGQIPPAPASSTTAKPASKPSPKPAAKPSPKPAPKPAAKPALEINPKPTPKSIPKSMPKPIAKPKPKPKPKTKPKPKPRPPAPPPTLVNNRLQYHQHLGAQTLASGEYEYCIEIGFKIPTGLKKGDTIIIEGRTAKRAGDEEAAAFLNRPQGHKVIFAEDYKHNDDGNGGRVWIEGHKHSKIHSVGGTKNEHTFDGARVKKK